MVGMHGCYTSNRVVADCDVLIALAPAFPDRVALNPKTFARNATIIQIDIDPSELGKNVDDLPLPVMSAILRPERDAPPH